MAWCDATSKRKLLDRGQGAGAIRQEEGSTVERCQGAQCSASSYATHPELRIQKHTVDFVLQELFRFLFTESCGPSKASRSPVC
jgi:hypothetical protein